MENSKQHEDKVLKVVKDTEANVEKTERSLLKNEWVRAAAAVVVVLVICGGFLYWQTTSTRIGIETSLISAPLIDLSPTASGQLTQTYVNVGDSVLAGTPVAQVGNEIIKTKTSGVIVTVQTDIGKTFNPGQSVVTMIDPSQLRVVGTIDENKGLSDIHVGQLANFTVDAFGGKQYEGVVDEVSATSKQTDVVFNISDSRAIQQFEVKVRFDTSKYPELKNGMSAKLTIFTK